MTEVMGEGGEMMIQRMMQEMPLSALTNFTGISEEQLDGILAMLNNQEPVPVCFQTDASVRP